MNSGNEAQENHLNQELVESDQIQQNSSSPINFYNMVVPMLFTVGVIGLSANFIIEKKYPFESEDTIQKSLSVLLIAVCGTAAVFAGIGACRRNYPGLFRVLEESQDTQNLLTGIKVTYDDQEYLVKAIQQGDKNTYAIAIKINGTEDDFSMDNEQPITVMINDDEAKTITNIEDVLALRNAQNSMNYQVDSLMEDLLTMLPQRNPLIN
ncbi:MAG: hypothetical protein CMF55_05910 [Legionellales bacterium]|nr:hypothetical protein [Legionellales bacterium]